MAPDAPSTSSRFTRLTAPWPLAGLVTLAAAVLLISGFHDHGLWSTGEIAVLQRAQADLGAALTGLERAPPLPDLLRTRALALTADPAAIRLPGALAGACLVGLAALLARLLGAAPRHAVLAAGFALAFPLLQAQSRLALGNPVGELLATLAALLGAAALAAPRTRQALACALSATLALALAAAAAGLVFGVLLPLLALALAWPRGPVPSTLSRTPAAPAPPDLSLTPSAPAPPDLSLTPSAPAPPAPAPDLSLTPAAPAPPDLSLTPSAPAPARPRWQSALLALAILATAALILALAYGQADGWIPALAAARDMVLSERPHSRPFTATFEELGDQLFPWLPLVILGLLHPGRARWPAQWLLVAVVLASAWSLRYGPLPLPITVPAAVVCAAGLEHLLSPRTTRAARRLGLLIIVAGAFIHAKDARRTPSHVGAVLVDSKGEHTYPAKELRARDLLGGMAALAAALIALAVLVRRPADDEPGRLARVQRGLPGWLPAAIVLGLLVHHALRTGHDLLPRTSELLSLHRPLTRHAEWHASGALPGPLAVHRISDPGVDLYGPPLDQRHALATRDATVAWLRRAEPSAALIRVSELAPVFQHSRQHAWPLHVLDASHRDIVLVANVLPPGAADMNPIHRVLFDAPPALPHETLVRFEDYLEIVAWDWEQPVVRGRETTLQLVLRVLKPLPAGSKITARLQQDKLSRVNPMPHDLAENIYPCQYWRPGDYILHRFTTTVPMLEILPGAHDLIVGLRRTESQNYKISQPDSPDDQPGPFGVKVRAGREFAVAGAVQVW
ncbi:MAG: hypothetical protein JNL82_21315 [Myxococcales bacterium]|nr:hypothetical protein [Myxococcales bacterium]